MGDTQQFIEQHFIRGFVQDKRVLVGVLYVLVCISVCLAPGIGRASSVPYYADGIYSTTSDDGMTIMLYRYKPNLNAEYNTNGTPVLLFPGICGNMNEFLSCTPEVMKTVYSQMTLPAVVADWAIAKDAQGNPMSANGKPVLEPYIAADHMKYYNLAHYLWLQGYDPWFSNYRDTGRENMHSGGDNDKTLDTLDTWVTLDAPAAIAKVQAVTGKRIFIGGHSTGGFAGYAYLQGCYMDYDGQQDKLAVYQAAEAQGYQRHVKGDPLLAVARNANVLGFVVMDPAGQPPEPSILNNPITWEIIGMKMYLPLDDISQSFFQDLPSDILGPTGQVIFNTITNIDNLLTSLGWPNNYLSYDDFYYMQDIDPYELDFQTRYALSGASMRCFGQYLDNGEYQTCREFWRNGIENKDQVIPAAPNPGQDGYYYYIDNMNRLTVPMIAICSNAGALVSPEIVYQTIYAKKTPNALDEYYIIQDTAHIDLAMGLKSPSEVFPKIGAWLDKVSAADPNTQLSAQPESTSTTDPPSAAAGSSGGGGSSGGSCFITSAMI